MEKTMTSTRGPNCIRYWFVALLYISLGVTIGVLFSYGIFKRAKLPIHQTHELAASTEPPSSGEKPAKQAFTKKSYWADVEARITKHGVYGETDDVEDVLDTMRTSKIRSIDIMKAGTSLKWEILLSGGQKFIFKPFLPNSTRFRTTNCNAGYEQPNYEIAAFHVDRMLRMRKVPYVTGRSLDARKEILPAAKQAVKKFIAVHRNGTACFSVKCYYCPKLTQFCYPDGLIPGALIYYFRKRVDFYNGPHNQYHPFQPYGADKRVLTMRDIKNTTICKFTRNFEPYSHLRMYMDIHDMNVLDYLILHLDRKHHYIKLRDDNSDVLSVHVDHGLSFCPNLERGLKELLSALMICCRMRRITYNALVRLQDMGERFIAEFVKYTSSDPLYPVISREQLVQMKGRFQDILSTVNNCRKRIGDSIFIDI